MLNGLGGAASLAESVGVALDVEEVLVQGTLCEPPTDDDGLLHAMWHLLLGLVADLRRQGSVIALILYSSCHNR